MRHQTHVFMLHLSQLFSQIGSCTHQLAPALCQLAHNAHKALTLLSLRQNMHQVNKEECLQPTVLDAELPDTVYSLQYWYRYKVLRMALRSEHCLAST